VVPSRLIVTEIGAQVYASTVHQCFFSAVQAAFFFAPLVKFENAVQPRFFSLFAKLWVPEFDQPSFYIDSSKRQR
jgi:hypothetical protein